ncbi:MAG: acetylornithine deacetylase [Nitriliruptoraceae bacterium]
MAEPATTEQVLAELERLVAFDTTSHRSNLELIAHVERLLDAHGIAHERVVDSSGSKANLIARIGPPVPGGVVLAAHTDCVPVTGQPWTTDPFSVVRSDGRLQGRGVADMKGFLAVVLASLPRLAAAQLLRPVLLVLTYDEEVGTIGAPSAVDRLLATQPRPGAVIVGEPTNLEPVTAHKGVRAFATSVEGRDGHSSQPQHAANAIAALVRVATYIDDLATRHREAAADPRFTPPHTTFNLATIRGGQAINIVPRYAELTWEYRPVPADDSTAIVDEVAAFAEAQVLPRLRATTGHGLITFQPTAIARGLEAEPSGEAERLVRRMTGCDQPSRTVPFGTDGGHFQAAGLSTVVWGPGGIEQAHQADEWIEIEQLETCASVVARLTDELSN